MPALTTTVRVVMAVSVVGIVAADAQGLRELARERAQTNPETPIDIPGAPALYERKTIEDLTKESVLVVVARLSRVRSYLGSAEDRVHTDYAIQQVEVVAGRLPVQPTSKPGVAVPMILTVLGGEVEVEGARVRSSNVNIGPISDNAQYLLFLMESRNKQTGYYEIYYSGIFEILDGKTRPLLRNGAAMYEGPFDAPLNELRLRIERSGEIR